MSSHPKGERRKLDAYYTPDDLARALANLVVGDMDVRSLVLEPNVGGGAWVRALPCVFTVDGMDLDPQARGLAACSRSKAGDFLAEDPPSDRYDLVIGNPPYRQAMEHIERAMTLAPRVAFLLRAGLTASKKRHPFWSGLRERGWQVTIHALVERPSFTGGGTDSCEYMFLVLDHVGGTAGPATYHWVSWKPKRGAA